MGQAPQAVVIGAGPGGLAAAAELRRRGVAAVVLERSDAIAASWRGRYDRLRLNTSRWTSSLPRARYPRGTPLFPSRDEVVDYLEEYAGRNALDVRLRAPVERIEREDGGWRVRSPAGDEVAEQVIVATGHQHTPLVPAWPGRERFRGRVLHAAEYRNAGVFAGKNVLVVGPGCSGMEIAYDLAEGGAARVWIAVRTQPNIMLRQSGGLPGDLPAIALLRLPPRLADRQALLVRRLTVGDLSAFGLVAPEEGVFSRQRREGKAPAIVDKEIIQAIRRGRIEVVPALVALDEHGASLADGRRLEPAAVIAATGYGTGLEPLAGHLGVLDGSGVPRANGGPAAAPGLRFIGYDPRPGQIGHLGREARRAAAAVAGELAPRAPLGSGGGRRPSPARARRRPDRRSADRRAARRRGARAARRASS
jgi:cation diffusion facilitator CzcD-associated flavoprotein CzcO